jgi:hypothetical protein
LRLKRLYDAIEAGIADLDDPALKDRIDGLKAIRDQAKADADRAQAMLENSGAEGGHAADAAQVRHDRPRAYPAGRRRLSPRPPARARRSVSRSPTARFASWDRSPGCYRRLWREVA